jgi:hypothetical protein
MMNAECKREKKQDNARHRLALLKQEKSAVDSCAQDVQTEMMVGT